MASTGPGGGSTDYPAVPPPGSYAAQSDLVGIIALMPDKADQTLVRALLAAVYDPTTPAVLQAFKLATVDRSREHPA